MFSVEYNYVLSQTPLHKTQNTKHNKLLPPHTRLEGLMSPSQSTIYPTHLSYTLHTRPLN